MALNLFKMNTLYVIVRIFLIQVVLRSYFIVSILRHKKFHMCVRIQARSDAVNELLIIYIILRFVILEVAAPLFWFHEIS